MSFDKPTRAKLESMVARCRTLLRQDIEDQLQSRYGMYRRERRVQEVSELRALPPEEQDRAEALRGLFRHYQAQEAGKDDARFDAAYDRLVHEIGFTVFNRLAALKLCEERGYLPEVVRKALDSEGFRVYRMLVGDALGSPYETYRFFLGLVFDELAMDLAPLFDRHSPQSAVFPAEPVLLQVLEHLNQAELAPLWREDETIGWIYQYFNDPAERKRMRDESSAPRNSREMAVRNQFFTPRYVVEFLVDNTLGRTWYEMRRGETALTERCRYLFKRRRERFLAEGEAPSTETPPDDATKEQLLDWPVDVSFRAKKDPRDLKMLDPACGSAHFLLYGYDVLEVIYEEGWSGERAPASQLTGRTLREDYPDLDALRRAMPGLILAHNLYGVDIDPRAVQIAALALWLRAQRAFHDLGLRPGDRPRIARSNLVVAEPMPGEDDLKREFLDGLRPRVLGQVVEGIFEAMRLAGEAGVLIRVEQAIAEPLTAARRQWETEREAPAGLFPELAKPLTKSLFDVSDVDDAAFWEIAEEEILKALEALAARMEAGEPVLRRLFADDAARGFAFIDLCRKRYDVVLTNPPFGAAGKELQRLLEEQRFHARDMAADFVSSAIGLTHANGIVGAITTRTIFFLKGFMNWRDSLVSAYGGPRCFLDIGYGVLDAAVEACAFTLQASNVRFRGSYVRALGLHEAMDVGGPEALWSCPRFDVDAESFAGIPRHPFAYWASGQLLGAFGRLPCVGDRFAVLSGGNPRDDFRFVRHWVEVPPDSSFAPYSKGGEFAPFYFDVHLALKWRDGGRELKVQAADYRRTLGWSPDWRALMMNYDHYFVPAITWPRRTSRLSFRFLPRGCIFGDKSPVVMAQDGDLKDLYGLMAYLNTSAFGEALELMVGSSELAQSFEVGIVKSCPLPELDVAKLAACATEVFQRLYLMNSVEEGSHAFASCWSPGSVVGSLRAAFGAMNAWRADSYQIVLRALSVAERQCRAALGTEDREAARTAMDSYSPTLVQWSSSCISYAVGCVFGRWDVRLALDSSLVPPPPDPFDRLPVCSPGMLVGPGNLPAVSGRIVSAEWLRARRRANAAPPDGSVNPPTINDNEYPIGVDWDGIAVDDPGFIGDLPHRDDIVRRIREVFSLLWRDNSHDVEQEACEILGVSELRDYLRRPAGFFQYHLQCYSRSRRKAPIYWPLSTASGSYTLWLYYPRLNDQTLYTVVEDYVRPKLAAVERRHDALEAQLRGNVQPGAKDRDHLTQLRTFAQELSDIRDELLRVAALPYRPALDDGVVINAAPLRRLFCHRPWVQELDEVWLKLEKGDYDWARMAFHLWPERVRAKCVKDRSLAIAHDLESICTAPDPTKDVGAGRGRRKKAQDELPEEDEE